MKEESREIMGVDSVTDPLEVNLKTRDSINEVDKSQDTKDND